MPIDPSSSSRHQPAVSNSLMLLLSSLNTILPLPYTPTGIELGHCYQLRHGRFQPGNGRREWASGRACSRKTMPNPPSCQFRRKERMIERPHKRRAGTSPYTCEMSARAKGQWRVWLKKIDERKIRIRTFHVRTMMVKGRLAYHVTKYSQIR